jgi:membrane-bound lytic murein transglycosylase A
MKFLLSLFLISSWAMAQEKTPTERVYQSLSFEDDLDLVNMKKVIARQMDAYKRVTLSGTIQFGTKTFLKSHLKESLTHFETLVDEAIECLKVSPAESCYEALSLKINNDFMIYRPTPSKAERGYAEKKTYFTSYYTPDLQGSYEQTQEYKYPIYGLPQASDQKLSRVEIDFDGKLKGKGLELLWVKNTLFDIYFMHIQGGGRVTLPNGEVIYLSYAGKNGMKFQFISQYLMSPGPMSGMEVNYWTQREFLEKNPEHQRAAYSTCPMFVFFKITDEEPHGVWDIPLTEGRSIAVDNTIYKTTGVINFIKTVKTTHLGDDGKPVKAPFSRFFLSQDTGSAIRGNARVDIYWGYGEEALFVAGKLMELGEQYFLIKK